MPMNFKNKVEFLLTSGIPGILGCFLFADSVHAAMSEQDYLKALKIADQAVARKKSTQANASSLSSSLIKSLFGRYYQVGDTWDVAAWQIHSSKMRMIGSPEGLKDQIGHGGIFHYEVLNVKTGIQPQVTLQVTQLQSHGLPIVDSKVTRLLLTMNDQLVQSKKTYFLKSNPSQGVDASPEGIHSKITSLELFPLDVPEVAFSERQTISTLPTLPNLIQDFSNQIGFKPDLGKSFWFEQDDFFGRPVQILWQQGDPWPSYFKTPGGIAILIRKGAQ
jgi:hypothetical protein